MPEMNDEQLLRYSRHVLLPEFDTQGQERLLASKALIVGLGGLGSPVAMYLAAAGVGELYLVDDDVVELSNIQRQIVHSSEDLGKAKVASAMESLRALNPGVKLHGITQRLAGDALVEMVAKVDVVVDASDNFTTRFALNAAAVASKTPLVSGAAIRAEGQLSVFDPRREDSPCYRCLYDEQGDDSELNCADSGVLAPVVGLVGSMQALEVVKLLAGYGEPAIGRLVVVDAKTLEFRSLRIKADPACPVCASS